MWRIKKKKEDKKVQKVKTGSATGTVNVGVSSTTVNIGNNLLGTSINLGNGTTGTSNINSKTVNISNGVGGTTNIYSPAVFLGNGDTGTTTIYSPNTNVGTTLSGTTNLYSPTMNIGVTGGTIALKATTSVATIDAAVPATGLQIGNNITTGNFGLLGNASFSGNAYIAASNTARTGTFDIVTAGTGAVSLGSLNAPLALRGSTITFSGTTTLATTNVATLDAIAPATGMEIGNNITGGNFGLLGNASFTGNVYIGANNTGRSGTADIFTAGTGTVSIGSLNATLALRGSAITLSGTTTTFTSPITLGTDPGQSVLAGATGTFDSDLLGHTKRINTTSLTISDYNVTNVVASHYVTEAGIYIVTWSIQQQILTPPNGMSTNIGINNASITNTANPVAFANYGMTKMGNIVYGSSGSIVTAIGAPRYCNLLLTVDGGASFSAPAVTFGLTRIG